MRNVIAFLLALALSGILIAVASDEGRVLYDKKCALCHGKDGVANKMGAGSANLNDAEWQGANSVEDIVKVTAEGKGKMPGFAGKLTDEQMKQIAEYIQTLK